MGTVKVRIAVAVDADGDWNAVGFSGARSDDQMMNLCAETVGDGEARYWLEAELKVPETPVVQADVAAA